MVRGLLEGRTATPVLRSRVCKGRVAAPAGSRDGLAIAAPRRRAATSGSTSPRPSRLSHETQSIASTVATIGGASHQRISTPPE